jgi:predicted RNA-binding Zn-ribbon protein involved in translation (DUF1610 family)
LPFKIKNKIKELMKESEKVTTSNKNGIIKLWRATDFECPECGDMAEVETSAPKDFFFDGDALRCVECEAKGQIMVDEGHAWDSWDW